MLLIVLQADANLGVEACLAILCHWLLIVLDFYYLLMHSSKRDNPLLITEDVKFVQYSLLLCSGIWVFFNMETPFLNHVW